jgi:hypothetical protein
MRNVKFESLQAVDDLLKISTNAELPEEMEGYAITGAIIIGLYVAPDGESVATHTVNLGAMNVYTQEGILNERLRHLSGMYEDLG